MALEWAVAQPSLAWIDLQVFAHNLRARKLYESFGFREMSVTKDLFRVNGQSIDDVKMSLRVHP
jgi:RimJ/RimL family protein N-acetyltransferase